MTTCTSTTIGPLPKRAAPTSETQNNLAPTPETIPSPPESTSQSKNSKMTAKWNKFTCNGSTPASTTKETPAKTKTDTEPFRGNEPLRVKIKLLLSLNNNFNKFIHFIHLLALFLIRLNGLFFG